MKKIISIFLSALMAVSVMALAPISAGAEDNIVPYYEGEDYSVCYCKVDLYSDAVEEQRTQNYLVENLYGHPLADIDGIYYIKSNDVYYSVTEACENSIVDEEELMSILKEAPNVNIYLLGDVNFDDLLDINDVTKLQLCLTGNNDLQGYSDSISDFNNDGVVDINDATAIQLAIAG